MFCFPQSHAGQSSIESVGSIRVGEKAPRLHQHDGDHVRMIEWYLPEYNVNPNYKHWQPNLLLVC